jgi:hypothetical protein
VYKKYILCMICLKVVDGVSLNCCVFLDKHRTFQKLALLLSSDKTIQSNWLCPLEGGNQGIEISGASFRNVDCF